MMGILSWEEDVNKDLEKVKTLSHKLTPESKVIIKESWEQENIESEAE